MYEKAIKEFQEKNEQHVKVDEKWRYYRRGFEKILKKDGTGYKRILKENGYEKKNGIDNMKPNLDVLWYYVREHVV